ncbi:hypothetical protein Tco_0551786 [Tanacetum coccineum]
MTNALTQSGLIRSFRLKASATTFDIWPFQDVSPAFLKGLICKVSAHGARSLALNLISHSTWQLEKVQVVSSVIVGILSIEARDMDTKLLSAPESNNTLARCWFRKNVPVTTFGFLVERSCPRQVASSGWPLIYAVPGQMTYLVASWGDSISPDGFLPSILLLVVIIIAVVIVVVTVVLVVVVGEGSSIIKTLVCDHFEALKGGKTIPFNTSGNPTAEDFHEFSSEFWHHSKE